MKNSHHLPQESSPFCWSIEVITLKHELWQTIQAHNHNADLLKHHKDAIDQAWLVLFLILSKGTSTGRGWGIYRKIPAGAGENDRLLAEKDL